MLSQRRRHPWRALAAAVAPPVPARPPSRSSGPDGVAHACALPTHTPASCPKLNTQITHLPLLHVFLDPTYQASASVAAQANATTPRHPHTMHTSVHQSDLTHSTTQGPCRSLRCLATSSFCPNQPSLHDTGLPYVSGRAAHYHPCHLAHITSAAWPIAPSCLLLLVRQLHGSLYLP